MTRLLEIVNKLLEGASSNERLYASYSGRDGRVILLTPEIHAYNPGRGTGNMDWIAWLANGQ